MHVGGCACGGVRFEIDGDLGPIQLCHCSICRKSNGSAFAANMPTPAAAFRLTAGADLLREFETSPGKHRTFCGTCGSPIHSRADAFPATLRIRAGAQYVSTDYMRPDPRLSAYSVALPGGGVARLRPADGPRTAAGRP